MVPLNIGEVAELAGVTAPTVRYYESIGLLKKPARSEAGYRRYSEATVRDLGFIRKARALGFSLDEIAEIIQLTRAGKRPCTRVIVLAKQRLADVDDQLRKLAEFRHQLCAELTRWEQPRDAGCDGLCEMIESSTPVADSELPARRLPARRGRKRS